MEYIRGLRQPREAFQLSRDPKVSRWRRSDWESVKDDIMLKALRAKFSDRNLRLLSLLLSTGDKKLIEHTSNDSYWGDGGNGTGSNKLGKLLMQVRSELSTKRGASSTPGLRGSRDDITLGRNQVTGTPPAQPGRRLHRSNSLSSIPSAVTRQKSEMVTGISSYPRSVNVSPHVGRSMSPQISRHTPHSSKGPSSPTFSIPKPIKQTVKAIKDKTTSAASQVVNVMKDAGNTLGATTGHRSHTYSSHTTPRSPGSHHHSGTASSVDYDIITNRPKYTHRPKK